MLHNMVSFLGHTLCLCSTILVSLQISQAAKVRLVGGSGPYEGLVHVLHEGKWKAICDDNWDERDAKVICRQLGYAKAINYTTGGTYASNVTKDYWLDDLYCRGSEFDIEHCWHRPWGTHNCREQEQAGVICSNETDKGLLKPVPSPASGQISSAKLRLKGGSVHGFISRGVLQVNYRGQWGAICADDWDRADAYVACGQLGYPDVDDKETFKGLAYGTFPYFWMTKVNCTGLESVLTSCDHGGWGPHKCKSKKPVLLACKRSPFLKENRFDLTKIQEHHVRLRAGYNYAQGRVEVFHINRWGSVCDDKWDITDANVVCRQVGFGTAYEALHWATFGQGSGTVWMDEVQCTGEEKDIRNCPHIGWRKSDCGHAEDAGVKCHAPYFEDQEVRLVGGTSEMNGRVEVNIDGDWHGVCGLGFGIRAGEVVCRQLGLGYVNHTRSGDQFGLAKIGMFNVECSGDEFTLKDCHHSGYHTGACRFYEMAIVECTKYAPDLVMDVKYLQKSLVLDQPLLYTVQCAYDEGCLSSSAATQIYWSMMFSRHLLRFSSRFWNRGTKEFEPQVHKDRWEWHSCHGHYHSLERFADYNLIDKNGKKVAAGHKASFCLEDTECEKGVSKFYNCKNKGDQGISVGCADNYKADIDCQWVDVTDVKLGKYILTVNVNPKKSIPESDYSNNAVVCKVELLKGRVEVESCKLEDQISYADLYTCEMRSFGGTGNSGCCKFPFIYKGKTYHSCIKASFHALWCSMTTNYDEDKLWGYC